MPNDDELEAGVEQLSIYGDFGTAVNLARRTNYTIEEVFNLPAGRVYTILIMDYDQSQFERKLRLIKERNAKAGGGF